MFTSPLLLESPNVALWLIVAVGLVGGLLFYPRYRKWRRQVTRDKIAALIKDLPDISWVDGHVEITTNQSVAHQLETLYRRHPAWVDAGFGDVAMDIVRKLVEAQLQLSSSNDMRTHWEAVSRRLRLYAQAHQQCADAFKERVAPPQHTHPS